MHIVCPHCTTSSAINLATLGAAGRTVRCARCKEVWLARPEDAIEVAAAVPAMAEARQSATEADAAAEWEALARQDEGEQPPVVDSPSISADWPAEGEGTPGDWPSGARQDVVDHEAALSRHAWAGCSGCPPSPAFSSCHPSACRPPAPRWARWCWRW